MCVLQLCVWWETEDDVSYCSYGVQRGAGRGGYTETSVLLLFFWPTIWSSFVFSFYPVATVTAAPLRSRFLTLLQSSLMCICEAAKQTFRFLNP